MTHRQRIAKALRQQVRPVLTILQSGDLYGAMATASQLDPMPIYEVLKSIENKVFQDEAERAYRNIDRLAEDAEKRNYVTDWLKVVFDYLTNNALNQLTTEITGTTYKNLIKLFETAISEGWGQLDVAKRIEATKEFEKLTFKSIRQRSLTIARTEVNRARNAGHQAAGDKSKWVTEKVWSAANDMRTRGRQPNSQANHWALNGVAVDQNELFTDPINGNQLAYPGDISNGASAVSVVNCRCRIVAVPKKGPDGRLIRKPSDPLGGSLV